MTPLPQLAREAERLRFRLRWHLPVDPVRVTELQDELLRRSPWHPLALNVRADEALPETALPWPGDRLAQAARRFLHGDLEGALADLVPDPRTPDTRARLLLALGRADAARSALDEAPLALTRLPSVLALSARIALVRGKTRRAWDDAVEALVVNPLHGSARVVLRAAGSASGRSLRSLPLRAPVASRRGPFEPLVDLPPAAETAWRAWHAAQPDPDGPPGAGEHRALLEAWRGAPTEARLDEDDTLRVLDGWERQGLLAAYEWSTGLGPDTAEAFRTWNASGHHDLRRFWSEGLRS